ncbi:MAG: protein kinase [Blastocatellia bacterium]|nr:protein kinase [Blastocatellia bacterium]
MTPERWGQIERLYHDALEREPASRAAFLASACAEDPELHREVDSLLASHDSAADFIESPPEDIVAGMIAEQPARSILGRTLGHYRIESLLGAGGMGEVYRAHDTRLDREVAVKILPERLAAHPDALKRFEREARAVAALSHPNILSIFDFGSEDGVSYAVMELLEGETLRERLRRGPLPWREAVEIAIAVCEGLAAAHAKGIIHRDLKPENLFQTRDGRVKILDFGIARVKRETAPDAETLNETATRPGAMMGTIGYMSPEQVRGEPVEAPGDLFAVGCVLYEMISGRRPFARPTAVETLAAILTEEPPPLAATDPAIPGELERLLRGCLAKSLSTRFHSAHDLAKGLRSIGAPAALPANPGAPRRRLGLVLSLVAVTLLGLASVWKLVGNREAAAIDSLAVLPLVNDSRNENLNYLSEGITEAVINALSQLPQLKRVIARSTVASYRGKEVDPRTVGRELKVRSVLTGKITLQGDNLILGAELVNAEDGARLWGNSIRRNFADAMLVQTELAQQIADNLRLKLTGEDRQKLAKNYTGNADAYRLYVQGRYLSSLRTAEGTRKGIALLQEAVRLDPAYALAYAGLASSHYDASSTYTPPGEAMPRVKAAAERALQLDGTIAEAHVALAEVQGFYERNWAAAEKEIRRALELNPGYAPASHVYGICLASQGRTEEAIGHFLRARELDPLMAVNTAWVSYVHYLNRNYDASIQESRQLIALDPAFVLGHVNLALACEQTGRYAEAEAEFNQWQALDPSSPYPRAMRAHLYAISNRKSEARTLLQELLRAQGAPNRYVDPYFIGLIYIGLGERDTAFAWLEKAYQARSEDMLNIRRDPRLDSLRGDPRLDDLMRRLKLAP